MDKKIGNIVITLLFFCFQLLKTENEKITINVTNKYQNPTKSVEIGLPFLIMVTCEGFRPDQDIKGFELLNNCVIQPYGTTQSTTYVNGKMTEKYTFTYVAVPSKKGILELGPVFAQNSQGKTISSSRVTIEVVDIQEYEHTGKEPYLLDIVIEPTTVYIGQKIKIFVKFCYLARFENLAIENIAIDDVDFGVQDKEWKNSKITISGKQYSCKEMAFEIYPKKVGTIIIPSSQASFVPEHSQDIGFFGLFGFSNTKVVESYPKQIEVLPLPEHIQGKVDAIGQFSFAELQIASKKAQVAEGIIAKMIVHGDGNFAVMHHPQFQAPATIHFYEGNSSVELNKKTFEWVLQSDKPGTFIIEPQIFTYFDPVDLKYKQLCTKAAQLIVEGKAIEQDKDEDKIIVEVLPEEEQQNLEDDQAVPDIEELVKKQTYYSAEKFYKPASSQMLQNWIMIILVILLLIIAFYIVKPYFMKIFFIQTLGYRILFLKYYYGENVIGMYQLFERLAKTYNFGLQSLELQEVFFKIKLSNEAFDNWKNFITMLLEFNFSKEKTIEDKKLALDLSKQWFTVILNCCKQMQKMI